MALRFEKINDIMRKATRKKLTPKPPSGLTKEGLFYWKIKNDFPWYAENFLKIRNKNSKLVPFVLNDAQIMFKAVDDYCIENNIMRRYIILKARQMGMSTLTEGLIFQETNTETFVRSLIVAHEEKASVNLFNMSKLFYEELPNLIRPAKKYNNGKILAFENPSNDEAEKQKNPGLRSNLTIATAGTGEVGRSATPSKLHISEMAFFPDAKKTMLGLLQGIPTTPDTLIILESTANGIGDFFHQQWQSAMRGESDYIPIFLPWFTDTTYKMDFKSKEEKKTFVEEIEFVYRDLDDNPVYTYERLIKEKFHLTYEQLNWRRWMIRNKCGGDEELFMQEYPSTPDEAFLATGRPKFNISSLKQYQTQTCEPLRTGYLREKSDGSVYFVDDEKGYISIWEEPVKNKYYCIGADVAEGLANGDYSCAICGDPESLNITSMWHGHIDPDLFGKEIVKLAKYYNEAYVGVEYNNHGLATINAIKRLEYWNLYFQKNFDKIANQITKKVGWTTSNRTKPLMIDKLAEFVRERWIGIKSSLLISELFTYVIEDNGSTNAQLGCYDDTVMATAIWLQLAIEGLGENYAPEVPYDEKRNHKKITEIVDPLFEEDNTDEYS